jgi:hypothetical protein
VVLASLLLVAGCSSFNREWRNAAELPASSSSLVGRWEGSWQSEANGHHGSLRCIVGQEPDGACKARFHAIYGKMLNFGYTVPLKVAETDGSFQFSGKANLGWWAGGVYTYEGEVRDANFHSTYRCKYDHGTFQMTRAPSGTREMGKD